jgi:hypothetical protein
MATSATPKPAPSSTGSRALPVIVFFDHDPVAHQLVGMNRFRRLPFSGISEVPAGVEQVFVVSSESQLKEHYDYCRKPNVRIVAVVSQRFRDPRFDGAVYAYVSPNTPADLIERQIDNAIDHIRLLENRREVNERLSNIQQEIAELNEIGAALSAEHDTEKLLELILTEC